MRTGDSAFFRLTVQGSFTVLHAFPTGNSEDDADIPSSLVRGTDGNFYGTTQTGDGAIIRITSAGVLTTVHSFVNNNEGYGPYNPLAGPRRQLLRHYLSGRNKRLRHRLRMHARRHVLGPSEFPGRQRLHFLPKSRLGRR